jgi:hypothetical protein
MRAEVPRWRIVVTMSRSGESDVEPEDADTSVDARVAAVISSRAHPVAALNPEAGNHAITVDPAELAAALRAGERTWQRFPYYEVRYGERGRRFTGSDSAWIVTTAHLHLSDTRRELRWLGELLAARGMPRWLLELHLAELHSELVAAKPENRTVYDRLLPVVAMLRAERLRHLDEATTAELIAEFDRRTASDAGPAVPEAGALLVAAVADERAGVKGSTESLLSWLADPERFSPEWVAAVTETLVTARKHAR